MAQFVYTLTEKAGVTVTDFTPRLFLKEVIDGVLNDVPCTGVEQNCLGVTIPFPAVRELFGALNELFDAGL